jgi:hypothetical protein
MIQVAHYYKVKIRKQQLQIAKLALPKTKRFGWEGNPVNAYYNFGEG